MSDSPRVEFLYASIEDTQATIRAMDIKAQVLLALLALPLTQMGGIAMTYKMLHAKAPEWAFWVTMGVSLVMLAAWLWSAVALIRALFAIDNPKELVPVGLRGTGTFYPGACYSFSRLGALQQPSAGTGPDAHAASLPATPDEVEKELTFEQLKVGYIAARKIALTKGAITAMVVWFIAAMVVWASHLRW